jgi:hypothetical protein
MVCVVENANFRRGGLRLMTPQRDDGLLAAASSHRAMTWLIVPDAAKTRDSPHVS